MPLTYYTHARRDEPKIAMTFDDGPHASNTPRLLDILRLGAYQLLHLEVPDYAAVSQAVGLAPRRAAGLVNAVLRAVARVGEDPALFPDPDADPAAWLAAWGSHPRWLVDRWLARWTVAEVTELVRQDNEVPPVTLRLLQHDPDEAVARLTEARVQAHPVGAGTRCVELAPGIHVLANDRIGAPTMRASAATAITESSPHISRTSLALRSNHS